MAPCNRYLDFPGQIHIPDLRDLDHVQVWELYDTALAEHIISAKIRELHDLTADRDLSCV